MRKSLSVILALFLMGLGLHAQDSQMVNHMALGVTVGTDGVGLELALPFSPYVQLRTGYSIFPYSLKKTVDLEAEFKEQGLDFGAVPVFGTLWKGGTGKVLLDVFPGKKTGFRFTVGAYIGPGKVFHGYGDLREHLEAEDYATKVMTYNTFSFTTDTKGYVLADGLMKVVTPYVGVGYGRAILPDSRLRFSVDLGGIITGGLKVQTYNYSVNKNGEPVVLHSSDLTDPTDGHQRDKGWIDRVTKFPFVPILKLNVYFLLF
jgi:hypothetical protein